MEVLSSRIILRVPDLARSRAFFERTIGLRIYREYGAGGAVAGVVYFLGGGFLELTGGGDGPSLRNGSIWIQVPSLDEEAARLVLAGVPVRKEAGTMPWGLRELWIEDPDGNELRLIEVPEGHPLRRRLD